MANEIRISGTLRYAKDQATASLSTSYAVDQTGSKYEGGVQTVGLTEEALVKNDIGTIGYLGVRNNDPDNFVEFGSTTAEYSFKLYPGEGAVMPWKHTNCYAKADTGACAVEYLLIES